MTKRHNKLALQKNNLNENTSVGHKIFNSVHYLYMQNCIMKKLLSALLLLFIASSCSKWRPKEYPDPKLVLPSNTWELFSHNYVPYSGLARDCRLPKYMVYREDGTGYFYYEDLCDSPRTDTQKFNWSYIEKTQRIMFHFTSGKIIGSGDAEVHVIAAYDDIVTLDCRTSAYSIHEAETRLIDGNYRPISNQ